MRPYMQSSFHKVIIVTVLSIFFNNELVSMFGLFYRREPKLIHIPTLLVKSTSLIIIDENTSYTTIWF